jgi:hypothetical protein
VAIQEYPGHVGFLLIVMPGLVPNSHENPQALERFTWMAGSSPAMTKTGSGDRDPEDYEIM